MLRIALALTATAAALAVTPTAASAQDGVRVFFPGDCQTNELRPRSIEVFCADGGMDLRRITWERYGVRRAVGHGVARVNDCEPSCAQGEIERFHAHVRLSRVRQCGDVPQFTRLRVSFPIGAPEGFRRGVNQRRPCADAPTR